MKCIKTASVFISVILTCCLLSVGFSAAAQKTITVDNGTGVPGESVDIRIMVDDPGYVAGMAFTLSYDPQYLTFRGLEPAGKVMDDGADYPSPGYTESYVGNTLFYQYNHDVATGRIMVTAASARDDLGITLFYARFTLKIDCPADISFPIGIEPSVINNPGAGYIGNTEIPILVGLPSQVPEIHEVTLVSGSLTATGELSIVEIDSLTPELISQSIDTATGRMSPGGLWQISTDPEFQAGGLVLEVMKASNPETLEVPQFVLDSETTYYCRVNADSGSNDLVWMPPMSITTPAETTQRTNGIPLHMHDPALDVNGNAIDDINEGIVSLKNAANGVDLGIVVLSGGVITMVDAVDPMNIVDLGGSRPDEMPFGLVSFKIELDPGVDTASLIAYFSAQAPDDALWYKYDPVNSWRIMADAVFSETRMSVSFVIEDGGAFDADGVKNGVIIDPSGPGLPMSSTGGSGGSCFIKTTAMKKRTVSEWLSAIISAVITEPSK